MKAILVEAATGKVSLVEVGDYTDIYKHLKCDHFEMPAINHETGDGLYCDGEAFCKDEPPEFFVHCPSWYPEPIAGNILFLGGDVDTGEPKDVTLTVPEIYLAVTCFDCYGRRVNRPELN